MPPPSQPQPVTRANGRLSNEQPVAGPSSFRMGSPMTGTSYTNGGGAAAYSINGARSMKNGGGAGSYGARFYGGGFDSPSNLFSTSITMGESFKSSSAAFGLPPPLSTSHSYRAGRSYAAAAKGENHLLARGHHPNSHRDISGSFNPANLSSSFAGMSFSMGSYSKSQVHNLMANAAGSRPRTDAELTRTYECCGNTHNGLHDLLEHVEDAHPFADPETSNQPQHPHIGYSPQVMAMDMDMDVAPPNLGTIEERASGAGSTRSSMSPIANPAPSYPVPTSASSSKPSTPNEGAPSPAPLSISDVLTSPFANSPGGNFKLNSKPPTQPLSATSNASTSSSPPDGTLDTPTTSTQQSPVFTVPKVGPTRGFLGTIPRLPQQRFDRAFNEVVAGSSKDRDYANPPKQPTAVAPGVLFASAVASLGIPTTPPIPGKPAGEAPLPTAGDVGESSTGKASTEPQLPQPSLFTTHKPWRCPNPGCNKAYKQSNGLKYHQQKGQCDFAIHDAVDLGLSVEEAEERSRPFVCAVGAGCFKRYRQMNGLKYHYLNSGEHGQYGLRMLQNGTHPMPTGVPPTPDTKTTPTFKPTPSPTVNIPTNVNNQFKRPIPTAATASRPYHIPSQIGATRPRMGVFPVNTNQGVQRPPNGLAGIGRAGVPVRPSANQQSQLQMQKPAPVQLPPIQRGRDAVLFAAVETMDL